tara:strand:- start:923 stop:2137 length:1215 start_codon:yes stop_codon:yes gene_type:complete
MSEVSVSMTLQGPRAGHLISLKNLGGAERTFTNFFRMAARERDHHVLLQTPEIHLMLQPEYADFTGRVHDIKRYCGIKLPRQLPWLRDTCQARMLDDEEVQAIVVWNKLRNHPLHFPDHISLIHYEHGSAWFVEPTSDITDYLSRLDGIICNSFAASRMLQLSLGISESLPCRVVRNSIVLPQVSSAHPDERFRVGFAGRLTGLKAPVIAIEALRELKASVPHAELWIAGEGILEDALKSLVVKWGLEESVHFCGLLSDMSDFYSSLDAFVCPSWREPFGNVVQEALAHGVPAIVGNVDGLPEQISSGVNGEILSPSRPRESLAVYGEDFITGPDRVYSPEQDAIVVAQVLEPSEIAQVLKQWAASPQQRREMGAAVRAIIAQDFCQQKYCQGIGDFIAEVVAG